MSSYYPEYGNSDMSIYMISTYWTVTTITTVGYGDISGTNIAEMCVSVIMMLVGVISFSILNASLASIISNSDSKAGNYQEKLATLDKAKKEYNLKEGFYRKLK